MDKGRVTEKFISILNKAANEGIPLLRSKTGAVTMAQFKWNRDIENFAKTGKLGTAEIMKWDELNLKQQHTLLEILDEYHKADDGEKLINVDMILCAMKAPEYKGAEKAIEKANTWVPESIWRPLAVTYQSQRPALDLDAKFHRLKGGVDNAFFDVNNGLDYKSIDDIVKKMLPEPEPDPILQDPKLPVIGPDPILQDPKLPEPEPDPIPGQPRRPIFVPAPTPKPETIKVVRHRYGEGKAHDSAVAHAKRRNSDPKRLTPQEREIALQNLQRMEELGLIAKGPEGTSNSDVYLYRLVQSKLYFHLQEEVKMSDGSYEKVASALGSESGKNHREVLKDLTSEKLDDETLKDYARTVNITEKCITNKGEARTTHKIPVRGNSSFKEGISNNVEVVQEQITSLNNTLSNMGQQYTEESKEYDSANAVALNQSNKSSGMC